MKFWIAISLILELFNGLYQLSLGEDWTIDFSIVSPAT